MEDRYLDGLPEGQRERLARVNRPGLAALRDHLAGGEAIAFLGAGVSAPLYPLWQGLIKDLLDAAADHLSEDAQATCRALASQSPDAVVELIRRDLGAAEYREVLREAFRVRRDPLTGRTWTSAHELVVRCNFAGVVTTNYDSGIANARMAIRPSVSGTGFASWTDDDALDRWRTRDVLQGGELPILYAHGHHNQPTSMVLSTTEYRRAYRGKLGKVLATLIDGGHLVWVGFSFADQRIKSIIQSVLDAAGTELEPDTHARHVAVMPWDPTTEGREHAPEVLKDLARIELGCRVVLYPVLDGDHSALTTLLAGLTDPRFTPAVPEPQDPHRAAEAASARPPALGPASLPGGENGRLIVRWAHGGERNTDFTGREEELGRLTRWAQDPDVSLIGVTAWGGAGKTATVTEWLYRQDAGGRDGARGVFAWSFYEDPSVDNWAEALLAWAATNFGHRPEREALSAKVLDLVRQVPLVLFLDGVEILQEGQDGTVFGHLLDGVLRSILTGLCQIEHNGLVVLTSRFPFADLENFDGDRARMLDVPPFTPAEGALLLRTLGASWLPEQQLTDLVEAVDGHVLAVAALAAAVRERPPTPDLVDLREELEAAGRTDRRVLRVLGFYAERLSHADKQLVAIVSLFQRPKRTATILALGGNENLGAPLRGWTPEDVESAVRQRLSGLLTWHSDATVSAHPLVRTAFRPMVLTDRSATLASDLSLEDLPDGPVASQAEALRLIEVIELLLDVGLARDADELYRSRTKNGYVWMRLPAARLGQRCASAFVMSGQRRSYLPGNMLGFYLNEAGLFAMHAGDMTQGVPLLRKAATVYQTQGAYTAKSITLRNLSRSLVMVGEAEKARAAADEALEAIKDINRPEQLRNALSCLAAALDLGGATAAAEGCFTKANRIQQQADERHLYSVDGIWWSDFLLRTARTAASRRLAEANHKICLSQGWNADLARCCRALAGCDLAEGLHEAAMERLETAIDIFRDGDYLVEYAATLPLLAECHRRAGNPDTAEQLCGDVIKTLTIPRGLVPAQARALVVRALARADMSLARDDAGLLARARDDAEHALRLATVHTRLPWAELDALSALARLDRIEGVDRGFSWKAARKRDFLIQADLNPEVVR
ncbi:SIR2 family protein [Nonomuraea sp. NPDC049400]|uniref:SIR2 family protein n=1 Tax=Nonomuraea sp. NPDC049400 TaxID=3364352 RepID=UPI0037B4146F